jgi:aminoglycoside phosphotransferase (APT) family kinase protein
MLERLNADHPGLVPPLLATDHRRVLLTNVPGGDNYHAGLPVLLDLVRTLVGLQSEWVDRVDELLALGAPDWRATAFAVAAADVLARTADQLDDATVARVHRLVDGLPRRFADLAECGLPDTLVHGDFHPGNTIGDGPHPVVLDWGDCGVGNPLLDQAAFTGRMDDADREVVLAFWAARWQARVPGSDPRRAERLIAPVAAVRQAMIYRMFLDNIEPDEQVYHREDPASWLRRAAELVAAEG